MPSMRHGRIRDGVPTIPVAEASTPRRITVSGREESPDGSTADQGSEQQPAATTS